MFTPVLLFHLLVLRFHYQLYLKIKILLETWLTQKEWYKFWYVIEQGSWTVFNQLPLLFVIGLPIGPAKKNNVRAALNH